MTDNDPLVNDTLMVTTIYNSEDSRYEVGLSIPDVTPPDGVELDDGGSAMILSERQAMSYTQMLLAAAGSAEHDATVLRQIRSLMNDDDIAVQTVNDLRELRLPHEALNVTVKPGVTRDGKAFLVYGYGGKDMFQLDPEAAREHAAIVLESIAVARLDTDYRQYLVDTIGLDPAQASGAVAGMRLFR